MLALAMHYFSAAQKLELWYVQIPKASSVLDIYAVFFTAYTVPGIARLCMSRHNMAAVATK